MRRLVPALLVLLLLLIPAAVIGYQVLSNPDRDHPGRPAADPAAQIARGAYLARAGDCAACHTARGGKPYAGGRPIATPFGEVFAPNITPDPETGIGNWSADDFWRALHNGKSRDGSFLYPAFPYTSYTRVSREDSDAIHAWMRTLPAVRQENRPHALRFPYSQRPLLAFWRALYFRPGTYQPETAQSAQWNRGAYLVQGLGHCAACHSGRNALGATPLRGDLVGGLLPVSNWYAPALVPGAASGIADWSREDLADLLKTGVSARSSVYGPMSEVVAQSLQYLAHEDIAAMATYLKSLPRAEDAAPAQAPGDNLQPVLERGAKLYERHCIDCHGADGRGHAPAYPPLAGNRSITGPSAVNAIRMVLNGGFPPSTAGNPRPYGMPPFGPDYSDADVAAVVSFIRNSWGNRGAEVTAVDVSRYRTVPLE